MDTNENINSSLETIPVEGTLTAESARGRRDKNRVRRSQPTGTTYQDGMNMNIAEYAEAKLNAVAATGINRMQTLLSHFKAGDIDSVDTDLEVLKYMI